MCPHTSFGNVKTIKQHYQCRTEQRIAQEVCGHVHQYGRIRIFESDTKEEMYHITRVRDNILKGKEQKTIQPTKGGHKMVTYQNYVSLFYCQITSCPSDGRIS